MILGDLTNSYLCKGKVTNGEGLRKEFFSRCLRSRLLFIASSAARVRRLTGLRVITFPWQRGPRLANCGTKQGRFETHTHALSNELGSE